MNARTYEQGWRELFAEMDENTGSLEDRIKVIERRGEYAQDLAKIERRKQEELAKTDPRSEGGD